MSKDSGRSTSITFDTREEREDYVAYAKQKGMTLSALAKMALFQYRAKYAVKGIKPIKHTPHPVSAKKPQGLYSHGEENGHPEAENE